MILIQETIDKYGYEPNDLKPHSNKKVVARCEHCGSIFSRAKGKVRGATYCSMQCSSRSQIKPIIDGRMQCSKCRDWKPVKGFGANAIAANGINCTCTDCRSKDRFAMKTRAIAGYGGVCNCCGEHRIELLTIDHVNNDGAADRRRGKHRGSNTGGDSMYRQVIREDFPDRYQVLCFNCNCSRYFYGECPHKREQATQSIEMDLVLAGVPEYEDS